MRLEERDHCCGGKSSQNRLGHAVALRVPPARFADPGSTQTRKAQTMRACSPGSAALLGHTIRPRERAETLRPLIIVGQLEEPALSFRRARTRPAG